MTISPPPRPPSRPRAAPASGLNPAQAEAVNAPAAPLLVLAGAGTGKTRVVIARIVNLVKRGTPPDRILAVTFTNKAAREMVARIGNRFGKRPRTPAGGEQQPAPPKPEVSTIHSLCVRILRRHARLAGYPDRFVIVDRGEQETTARKVLKELRVAEATLRPADLLDRISRWKSRGVRAEVVFDTLSTDADDSWDLAAAGYQRYQRAMQGNGAVDLTICCWWSISFLPSTRRSGCKRRDGLTMCWLMNIRTPAAFKSESSRR